MSDLRIAVLGVGMMGADHVARITSALGCPGRRRERLHDREGSRVAASVPGARVAADPFDAIADDDIDAILLATPGPTRQLLACLERRASRCCVRSR